ncbi:MAG: nitroreductase family protein [Halanaerobium sp.]|nr:nitroreductase family protein [Halanaerobium sp.]
MQQGKNKFSDKQSKDDQIRQSRRLLSVLQERRSCRSFQKESIPEEVITNCIAAAASAPSGANLQPWTFVLVVDPDIKREIRRRAEEVEKEFYQSKITTEWRNKLEPLGTNFSKPFLEEAPYLICIFLQKYGLDKEGNRVTHYYPRESVGIATGLLISSLQQLGISTLTYTPSPMNFLNDILDRPENERAYMILPVGYPAEGYQPPDISRKTEDEYLIKK